MRRTMLMRAVQTIAVTVAVVLVATGCQPAEPWKRAEIDGWTPVKHYVLDSLTQDQGMATVYRPSPTTGEPVLSFAYGGELIEERFTRDGWNHVGDPDSHAGFIVYPYQAADFADGKMFHVVTPHNRSFRYTHALEGDEEGNNSFASISPDGQWMVTGEWDTQGRLLVFPMPILNPAVPVGDRAIDLAATITLSSPLDQVQGCDFRTPTTLLCSVDDARKRLVQVTLPAPLDGTDATGTVTTLGSLPTVSTCTGSFETEGIDFDTVTKLLRVSVIPPQPCFLHTDQYIYRPRP